MTALTKDRRTAIKAQGTHRHHRCKVAVTKCIKGGIAAKNAAGYLLPATDTAALHVVGIFEETVDNTGGSAGDLQCNYITGVEVELENAGGITQAVVQAYVADDQTVTSAAVATNDIYVGPVTEFTATKATVIIDEAVNLSPPAVFTALDGGDAGTVANVAVAGGIPVIHVFEIVDAATADYDITLDEKTQFFAFKFIKTGAAGVAVTCTMKNTATAITDAVDLAIADKATKWEGTIDDASATIAAGGKLRASIVRTTSGAGVTIVAMGFKRA